MKFDLEFHPASEKPTVPGDYVIYNQCDGYHLVGFFALDEDDGFRFFAKPGVVDADFYCAWAKLPDSLNSGLFEAFARKPE